MNQEEKIIKPKVGLLELARQLGNVSQACKVMGYSRFLMYIISFFSINEIPPSGSTSVGL